jgi:hypothetical protein
MSEHAVDSPPTTAELQRRIAELESDIRFLARGVKRSASGQGSAYTAEDFKRLDELVGDA